MPRFAAAYIRRSSTNGESPGDASREAQTAANEALAKLHALDVELRQFVDWGISGRRDDRPEYVRLKEAIEAGEVCCVFSYSLSRLGRSNGELDVFFKLCAAHDVTVYTKAEGALGKTSAMGGFLLTVMSAMAELESELAKERSAAAREARRARHEAADVPLLGSHPPYGTRHVKGPDGVYRREPNPDQPIEPILDAFREAGSVLGACTLLKERGIRAPRGGERWSTSLVTRIIEANAPELLPRRTTGGRRTPSSAMFSGLLRCPFCPKVLTPNTHRGQYYCSAGAYDRAGHPRYVVREQDLMPWIKVEAQHLDIPADAAALEGIEARQAAINDRLDRAHELYIGGDIDRAKYEAEKARAYQDLGALESRASVADIAPEVDWDNPPTVINTALRAIWREVRLDSRLMPVEAEWIVPEWRS